MPDIPAYGLVEALAKHGIHLQIVTPDDFPNFMMKSEDVPVCLMHEPTNWVHLNMTLDYEKKEK